MNRRRRALGTGSICLLGLASFLYHLSQLLQEGEIFTPLVLGGVVPIVLSAALVVGGVWLHVSPLDAVHFPRILLWVVGGGVASVLVGYPIVLYEQSIHVRIRHVRVVVENLVTAGLLVGAVVGTYDARERDARRALERRREALNARNHRLARQNERLEEFASLVSHDLRNPLNVATGRLTVLRETADAPEVLAQADVVDDALDRMNDIVDEILTAVREGQRIEDDDLTTVSLAHVAEASRRHVDTSTADVRVDGDATFLADESRLRHVFENLFRNSVDHAPEGVTVRVGPLASGDGFYVADDGPGIDAAERDRLFEMGYTTDSDGTGIGLYLVDTIADAHGWTVRLADGDDGARFEFTGVEFVDDA